MPANTRAGQWRPYRFEPVLYPGVDFRLTYQHNGGIVAATLTLGDRAYPFTVTGDAAEVVVRYADLDGVLDRAPAAVDMTLSDGSVVALLRGHVVRYE